MLGVGLKLAVSPVQDRSMSDEHFHQGRHWLLGAHDQTLGPLDRLLDAWNVVGHLLNVSWAHT